MRAGYRITYGTEIFFILEKTMISEKILVNPGNKKIEDTITLTYDQRFIRRKKLVSDNNFGFLVNLSDTVSLKKK